MTGRAAIRPVCLAAVLLFGVANVCSAVQALREPEPPKPLKHDTDFTALIDGRVSNATEPEPMTVDAAQEPALEAAPTPPRTEPAQPAPEPEPEPEPFLPTPPIEEEAAATPEPAPEPEPSPAPPIEEEAAATPEPAPAPSPQLLRLQETYEGETFAPVELGGDDTLERPELVQLAVKATMWLLAICAAIILLGLLLKRIGRRTPLLAGPQLGRVLGRIYLNPKVALHYVRSGGRVLVVAVTPGGASLISEYDADAFERAAGTGEPRPVQPAMENAAFEERLRDGVARFEGAGSSGEDDDIAALRGDIERLRGHLRETTRDPRDS